jgi:peptide deformylase
MAVLPIVEVPDPRLRLVSKPVETIDDTTRAFVADMIETMYDAHGIGLAAIQVGVDQRILVIDLQDEILSVSDETKVYNEGCLSIPEQYAEVARPAGCRVRWQDETGATHEEDLEGLLSTCMQHEIDHLNGVLFIDHISRLKRDMVMKKLAKMRRAV